MAGVSGAVRETQPVAHLDDAHHIQQGRIVNVDELQTYLEGRSPEGVGFGFRLDQLGRAVQRMLARLQNRPSDGVNRNLPLPIAEVAASFSVDPATFRMDGLSGAISLDLDLWLHQQGDPATAIYVMGYRLQDEAVVAGIDHAAQRIFLEPRAGSTARIHSQSWGADADLVLVRLGYVDAAGLADRARFQSEVITPFQWLNARGLLRAIVRSFPVPDVFSWFETIRPVGAISADVGAGYLIAWSESAAIAIPDCALPPSQGQGPSVVPDVVAGVPKPWSAFDLRAPGLMLYYAATPLLDWHAGVFMPAVAFHQEHDGFPGWAVDGHVGVQRLRVRFEPRADGGALTFDGELRVLGHASSWINGPCGLRVDVGTATFSGPGTLQGELAVSYSRALMALRSALAVAIDVPSHTLNLSAGGLLGGAWIEIVEWLLRAGVVRLDLGMQNRSEQTLLDLLQQSVDHGAATAFKRVAERSVAVVLDWDAG